MSETLITRSDDKLFQRFPWLQSNPLGLEAVSVPKSIDELGDPKKEIVLRLFLEFVREGAPDDFDLMRNTLHAVVTVEGAGKMKTPPPEWSPGKGIEPTPRLWLEWVGALKAWYTDSFYVNANSLKQVITSLPTRERETRIRAATAGQVMNRWAEQETPPWLPALLDHSAKFEFKENFNKVVTAFHGLNQLADGEQVDVRKVAVLRQNLTKLINTEIIAGIVQPAFTRYSLAQGDLTAAIRTCRAHENDERREDAIYTLSVVFVQYSEAVEFFARAIARGAEKAVDWLRDRAKEVYKENLFTLNPQFSENLMVMSTCCFLATSALSASALAFPPLGLAAGAMALTAAIIKNRLINAQANKAVNNRDLVKRLNTVRFEAQIEPNEALVKASEFYERSERVKMGVETLVTTAKEIPSVMNHETAKAILENAHHLLEVSGTVTTVVGVNFAALSLALEFIENSPKEEFQKFKIDQLSTINSYIDHIYDADGKKVTANRESTRFLGVTTSSTGKALYVFDLEDKTSNYDPSTGRLYEVELTGESGKTIKGRVDPSTQTVGTSEETIRKICEDVLRVGKDNQSDLAAVDKTVADYLPRKLEDWRSKWEHPNRLSFNAVLAGRVDLNTLVGVRYLPKEARYEGTATVTYTLDFPNASMGTGSERGRHTWQELGHQVRLGLVNSAKDDELIWVEWYPHFKDDFYIPAIKRHPNLIGEDFIANPLHPYRRYVEVDSVGDSDIGKPPSVEDNEIEVPNAKEDLAYFSQWKVELTKSFRTTQSDSGSAYDDQRW